MRKTFKKLLLVLSCVSVSLFAGATTACGGDEGGNVSQSSQQSVEQVADSTYSIVYYYERLNGGYEEMENEVAGVTGTTVEIQDLNTDGYELDTANTANKLSGVVTADGTLRLVAYYKLKSNAITVTEVANATVTYTVNGAQKTSIRYGETVVLSAIANTGYKVAGFSVTTASDKTVEVDASNSFVMPSESVTVTVTVVEDDSILYTVRHYVESFEGGYELFEESYETGKTGASVTAEALIHNGLTENTTHENRMASGTIVGDGSLVLSLYYTRNVFSVTVAEDSLDVEISKNQAKFGESVTITVTESVTPGYHVTVYVNGTELVSSDGTAYPFVQPSDAVTIRAVMQANTDTPYKTEYYFENLDGSYTLYKTENLKGTTDSTVEAEPIEKSGYTLTEHVDEKLTGTVLADGTTTLKLYYNRNEYTVTFVDETGATISQVTSKYGEDNPKAPAMAVKEYKYWSVNKRPYNESGTLVDNITVEKTAYDAVISNKAEFYVAFGAIESTETSGKYVSENVATGAYLLINDIDFGGDTVDLKGLGGLLEGNGYALKNINMISLAKSGEQGLFKVMSGIIRNISFENVQYNPWTYFIMEDQCGISGRGGIVAAVLSGTLENVYIQGSMLGKTQSYIIWEGATWKDWYPANDEEGIPVAGYVAYDATGATLKNVIVDVDNEYRNGGTTTISLIAGKGAFIAENVFVIAEKGESLTDRTAVRGLTPDQAGVKFDTLSNLLADITEAYEATDKCDLSYIEENLKANVGILNRGCVVLHETNFTLSFEGLDETLNVQYGEAIGALPELESDEYIDAYWTVDGRRITAETIWRFAESKTAVSVYKNPLLFNFEEEVEYEIAGNTGSIFKNVVGSGAFVPKNESTACVIDWYIGSPVNDTKALRLGINQGNIELKIKISQTAVNVLAEGGSLSLYAKAFLATNNGGTMQVGGVDIPSAYNQWTADWVKVVMRNVTVVDGYVSIPVYAMQMAMYVVIDDIKIIPASALTEWKLTFADGTSKWVTAGQAIGTLPELQTDAYTAAYWTIDGEKITEETLYTYGADKTAVATYKSLLVIDFEDEVEYTTTGGVFKNVIGNGEFTPSQEDTACTYTQSVVTPVKGVKAIRLGLKESTTLKIQLSSVALDTLANGGALSFSVKGMLAVNDNGTLNVGGVAVSTAYGVFNGEWTKITLKNLTADQDGYVSIEITVTGAATYVVIDELIVMPKLEESVLAITFDEDVDLIVENKVWSNATIVADGAAFDTNSNSYKGTSSSSPYGYNTAQSYDAEGRALLVAAGAGPMTIKVKLTTETLLAVKAGASMSLQAKSMVCGAGSAGYVPHIYSSGTWTSMDVTLGSWTENWVKHEWTNAQVAELLTDDGYLKFQFHPQQASLIYFLLDEITFTLPA